MYCLYLFARLNSRFCWHCYRKSRKSQWSIPLSAKTQQRQMKSPFSVWRSFCTQGYHICRKRLLFIRHHLWTTIIELPSSEKTPIMKQTPHWRDYLFLHSVLLLYAAISVVSKIASRYELLSLPFLLLYGVKLAALAVYALFWREALKHFTLTSAYLQKTVTVIWGLVFGMLLFDERLTAGKLVGMTMIVFGLGIAMTEHE